MTERESLLVDRIVGREISPEQEWDQHREEHYWIGKPWRRFALLRNSHFWKGEEYGVTRDWSLHLGFRRLGLGFTLSVVKTDCLDYSEETP